MKKITFATLLALAFSNSAFADYHATPEAMRILKSMDEPMSHMYRGYISYMYEWMGVEKFNSLPNVIAKPLDGQPYYSINDKGSYYSSYRGECVALVKAMANFTAHTSTWKPSTKVGDGSIRQGAVIATFVNGKYKGHTAIYLGENSQGIFVFDQNWENYQNRANRAMLHFIPFGNKKFKEGDVNNAYAYYVVK